MKVLIALLIIAGVGFVGWKAFDKWDQTSRQQELGISAPAQVDERSVPGLDARLENSLAESRKSAKTLRAWLDQYQNSPLVKDPRLAWIELDYALLVNSRNPAEGRKLFAAVRERVPADSPVYPRIIQLQKTFE